MLTKQILCNEIIEAKQEFIMIELQHVEISLIITIQYNYAPTS
jgi:hypothetical protein